MNTDRLAAFSDGVIAIAITLLILEIKVPEGSSADELWRGLGHQWPSYVGYAISFLTIGIMWVNHHAVISCLERADHSVLYWNLFLLASIAFVPFTTAVVAHHLTEPGAARVAAVVYNVGFIPAGVGFVGLWWCVRARPELRSRGVTDQHSRAALRRSAAGPVLYGFGAAASFFSAWLGLAFAAALALFFAFSGRPARRTTAEGSSSGS